MVLFLIRRIASALSVIVVTLIVSFCLFYLAPTDPAGVVCGAKCTPARYEEISKSMHLDEPMVSQIGGYLKGLVAGREYVSGGIVKECSAPCLGYSYALGQPVTTLLAHALPVTMSIVLGAAVVYTIMGLLIGTYAARRRGMFADRAVIGGTLGVSSVPYFVAALVASLYVPLYFGFFPNVQWTPITDDPFRWFSGLILPWLVLGIFSAATYTRFARASMIESLGEDYMRTARAKGLTEKRVVYRHGMRAALTPVVTILGLQIAFDLTGAIFTESIFGLPGLGLVTLRAFGQYDLPVLMGGVLVGVIVLVTMNLIVDILYTILDPRVRLA
jgi:peptide/nickel transport system permease protein